MPINSIYKPKMLYKEWLDNKNKKLLSNTIDGMCDKTLIKITYFLFKLEISREY